MSHPPTTMKTIGGFIRVLLSQLDHPLSPRVLLPVLPAYLYSIFHDAGRLAM